MRTIDAKLCFHYMFQNSFQTIERQKHYRNFWGDRSELWPSIYTDRQTNRQTDKLHTYIHTYRQTDRQTDRVHA